jgi:hypothetical protein
MFQLSDGAFEAMTGFDRGGGESVLAGVDKAGGLHLFNVDPNGVLKRLNEKQEPQPSPDDASQGSGPLPSNFVLTSSGLRPPVWLQGTTTVVAVAAKGDVWVRKESPASVIYTAIPVPFGGTATIATGFQPAAGAWAARQTLL